MHGKVSYAKRNKIITQFHNPDSPERVLIFSSVGNAGVNLANADVVLFFVSFLRYPSSIFD